MDGNSADGDNRPGGGAVGDKIEPFDADRLAAELRAAEPGPGHVPLFTERFPRFDWSDARAVARARDRLRLTDGETQIGYKLGWTSSAMRRSLGIDRPNWGTVWDCHRVEGGDDGRAAVASIDLADLRHPKVEPELVYQAGAELSGPVTVEEVAAAAASWAVGLEVVDPRFADFGFQWLDNTADNSSVAAVIIGDWIEPPGSDPATWTMEFSDGNETRAGDGSVVMGSPLAAVAWLVNALADEGLGLAAGAIVFTGGMTAPFDVTAGRRYRAAVDQLGAQAALQVGSAD